MPTTLEQQQHAPLRRYRVPVVYDTAQYIADPESLDFVQLQARNAQAETSSPPAAAPAPAPDLGSSTLALDMATEARRAAERRARWPRLIAYAEGFITGLALGVVGTLGLVSWIMR